MASLAFGELQPFEENLTCIMKYLPKGGVLQIRNQGGWQGLHLAFDGTLCEDRNEHGIDEAKAYVRELQSDLEGAGMTIEATGKRKWKIYAPSYWYNDDKETHNAII